jgi:hypothetical protein
MDGGRQSMNSYDHARAVRTLSVILAVAIFASIVHYTDNAVNFEAFTPPPDSIPSSPGIVVGFWFAFTAAGLAGYIRFRRAPSGVALALLSFYSGSGLIGIGHYLVPDATSMPWWRQGHVLLDIASGVAVLAFTLWAARARRDLRPAAASRPT